MWDQGLPGCFGVSDLIFAGHPNDEERAFEWLADLRRRKVGWMKARSQIEAYLKSKSASDEHIVRQTNKAEGAMKFWLLD